MKGIITTLNELTESIKLEEYLISMGEAAFNEYKHACNYTMKNPSYYQSPFQPPHTFHNIKVHLDYTIDPDCILLYKVVERSKRELE